MRTGPPCQQIQRQSSAADQLVAQYLPLARRLAMRYRYTSEPIEDLVQVASVGLVLAARRYDPERGISFSSFAVPTILGELRRHIRDHCWAVRVPRSVQENALRVGAATREFFGRFGRSPSPREIAAETGLDVEQVLEATIATAAYETASLDQPLDGDRQPSLPPALGSVDEPGYLHIESTAVVWPAVRRLPPAERTVVALRFHADLTQSEIAARIGVSQMQVSRLLRRALDRIGADAAVAA